MHSFIVCASRGRGKTSPKVLDLWRTIYGWYQQFDQLGIWTDILRIMAKGAKGKARYIDGTHIRVHQAVANPAGGAQAQAMGKTKGGRNSKLMLMVDLKGRPVAMLLVPGQDYEGHHVVGLIEAANLPRGLRIVGDKAHDDDKLRFQLTALGFETCFPTKSNRKENRPMHRGHYRKRYRVENCFCRLKRWVSVATRRAACDGGGGSGGLRQCCSDTARARKTQRSRAGIPDRGPHSHGAGRGSHPVAADS